MKYYYIVCSIFILLACSTEPRKVLLGKDSCHHCRMNIADAKFACEAVNTKGKTVIFDDVTCMINNEEVQDGWILYVADFDTGQWLEWQKAFWVHSVELHSPMNGNIAAFSTKERAEAMAVAWKGTILSSPYEKL